MEEALRDRTARRLSYDDWRGRNGLDHELHVWRYFMSDEELPGWRLEGRVRTLVLPDRSRRLRSIWLPHAHDTGAALRVNVVECCSREGAHDMLLSLLGQIQSPYVGRLENPSIGDVVFGTESGALLIFARANLIIAVANAGRHIVSARETARQFDSQVHGTPTVVQHVDEGALLTTVGDASESLPSAAPAPVLLEPCQRRVLGPGPLMYKFRSSTGTFRLRGAAPEYVPDASAPQAFTVEAITPSRALQADVVITS